MEPFLERLAGGTCGRRTLLRTAALASALPACWRSIIGPAALPVAPVSTPWPQANAILAGTALPRIPPAIFRAESFKLRGDGVSDDTEALQGAIDACHAAGGGQVVVPAGVFRTGALRLRSRVELRLAGAIIRFSGDPQRFPPVATRYEGLECVNRSPMLYAHGETDVAVTGDGTLDAAATARWNRGSDRERILEPLVSRGVPPERRIVVDQLRTAMVELNLCARVRLQGLTLAGAPFWQVHPTLCTDVTIEEITTSDSGPNSDACDPESCDRVVIRRCTLASGDDDIALKSGRDEDGRRLSVPCRNVVIVGCQAEGRYGFLNCGSEQTGGIENVYAFANRSFGAGVGHVLWVKSNPLRGGWTRNVNLSGFSGHIRFAVVALTMGYAGQSGSSRPVFENIHLDRLTVDGAQAVLDVEGLPASRIRDLAISDSTFTDVLGSDRVRYADVALRDVAINGQPMR